MSINRLYMNEELELEVAEESHNQNFRVKDLASLNWTLRKLTAIESKKREIKEMIEVEMDRLKYFLEKETAGLTESESFFKGLITEYAAHKREEEPDYKIKTPYGKVAYRKQPDKWIYDEELLVAYLEQNAYTDLIRTKKEPVKTDIKRMFKVNNDGRVFDVNGQEVAGITVEPQLDVLDIKPLGGAEA